MVNQSAPLFFSSIGTRIAPQCARAAKFYDDRFIPNAGPDRLSKQAPQPHHACRRMPQLIFTSPEFEGQAFKLHDGKTTVGRAPGNLLIIEDNSISANHCEILVYGREVIIRDLGSRNGTWVAGQCIQGQTAVQHRQSIRLGAIEARLELPPPTIQDHHTEITAIYLLARHPVASTTPSPNTPTILKPRPAPTL